MPEVTKRSDQTLDPRLAIGVASGDAGARVSSPERAKARQRAFPRPRGQRFVARPCSRRVAVNGRDAPVFVSGDALSWHPDPPNLPPGPEVGAVVVFGLTADRNSLTDFPILWACQWIALIPRVSKR